MGFDRLIDLFLTPAANPPASGAASGGPRLQQPQPTFNRAGVPTSALAGSGQQRARNDWVSRLPLLIAPRSGGPSHA